MATKPNPEAYDDLFRQTSKIPAAERNGELGEESTGGTGKGGRPPNLEPVA